MIIPSGLLVIPSSVIVTLRSRPAVGGVYSPRLPASTVTFGRAVTVVTLLPLVIV